MLVLKRRAGESVEILGHNVTVKVARVIDSQSVWLVVRGESCGLYRKGDQLKIGKVTLCVSGFHGSKVKLGFDAPAGIQILRSELLRGAA